MKQIIIFLIFLSNSYSFSQNKILTDSTLKPGIYLTVENLVKNQPIEFENLNILKDSVEYGTLGNKKFMEAYRLDISKEQAKKLVQS